jgi:hypothetical protein
LAKDRKSGHYYRATFQELSSAKPRSCRTHRTSFNRTDQKLAAVIGCLGATEHKTGLRKALDPKIPNHLAF